MLLYIHKFIQIINKYYYIRNNLNTMYDDQAQLFWAKAQNKIKKPKIRILKSLK